MRSTTATNDVLLLFCITCFAGFVWDSSPDLDRCQPCAEVNEWYEALRPQARRELTEM